MSVRRLLIQAPPYLAWSLLTVVVLYPFIRFMGEGPPDSGIFLNGAAIVAQGGLPSRDFIEPSGPGFFFWLGLFFRLFGTSLLTAQVLLTTTGVAITLLVVHLSRRIETSGFFAAIFILVILVPLLPYNNPHYESIVLVMAALAVFVTDWKRRFLLSGLLCGITSWFLQQEGLYLALALSAALLWQRYFKSAAYLIAAYAGTFAAVFVTFAALHALPDLLYANYIRPFRSYSSVNAAPYGFPIWQNLWPTFLSAQKSQPLPIAWTEASLLVTPFLFVAVLPVLLPLAALAAKSNPLQPRLLPYWLAAYALWFSESYRLDIGHLRNGSVLLAVLFFGICENSPVHWLKTCAFAIAGCLVFGGVSHLTGVLKSGVPVETRRGVIYQDQPLPIIEFLQSHTKPGDDVFIYPYQPIHYFLTNTHNPTRYHCLIYGYNSDAEFHEATRDLERKKVRYVFYDTLFSGENVKQVFPAYRQPDVKHLIMEPYLAAHYREVAIAGRFRVLERRD